MQDNGHSSKGKRSDLADQAPAFADFRGTDGPDGGKLPDPCEMQGWRRTGCRFGGADKDTGCARADSGAGLRCAPIPRQMCPHHLDLAVGTIIAERLLGKPE